MIVKVKLKKCKKATVLSNIANCIKYQQNIIITSPGPCAIVYSVDDVEDLEVLV